ncbi:Lipoxygenase 1, chloroplastic, partial [Linum perenne]
LRGDGTGVRKLSDRIYDYAIYNDLGNPDKGIDYARPALGGERIPYPRRCRTGREPTYTDANAESRVEKPTPMYVPRNEQFEESKKKSFSPPLMRRHIPDQMDPEYVNFQADPQKYFLSALPSLLQATKFMAVEYLGERQQPSIWSGDAEVVEAFYEFSAEIQRIEKEIERRNNDPRLKSRCGA